MFFIVDTPGEAEKSCDIILQLANVQQETMAVFAVDSSGIAATLLER